MFENTQDRNGSLSHCKKVKESNIITMQMMNARKFESFYNLKNLLFDDPANSFKNNTHYVMYLFMICSFFFRLDKRFNEQMMCDSCYHENIQMKATCFCSSCNCPDPLCKACAQAHLRQKATMNHKICNDLNLFPSTQKRSNKK